MILIETGLEQVRAYCEEHRTDKDSAKPYFIEFEQDGVYQLPYNRLIVDALKAIGINYTYVTMVNGVSFEMEVNGAE